MTMNPDRGPVLGGPLLNRGCLSLLSTEVVNLILGFRIKICGGTHRLAPPPPPRWADGG